jgi:hypothetical protein
MNNFTGKIKLVQIFISLVIITNWKNTSIFYNKNYIRLTPIWNKPTHIPSLVGNKKKRSNLVYCELFKLFIYKFYLIISDSWQNGILQ